MILMTGDSHLGLRVWETGSGVGPWKLAEGEEESSHLAPRTWRLMTWRQSQQCGPRGAHG